jgi:hypothetical protein
MKNCPLLLTIIIILTLQLSSFAQEHHNIERIGYWGGNWGEIWDIEIQGDYAYLTADQSGLRIVDISNPESPEEISFFYVGGKTKEVVIEGNIAYVANQDRGLEIIDISDPQNPAEISTFQSVWNVYDVALKDGKAFLLESRYIPQFNESNSRLIIIDVEDPEEPMVYGICYFDEYFYSLKLPEDDQYVYAIGAGQGRNLLNVIDISDPESPEIARNSWHGYGNILDMVIEGNYAYVTHSTPFREEYFFQVLNISNPLNPDVIGSLGLGNRRFYNLTVNGSFAYLTNFADSVIVKVISTARPEHPVQVRVYPVSTERATSVASLRDCLFIGTEHCGLSILNISEPYNPEETGFLNPQYHITNVIGTGDYLYTGNNILNVSESNRPELVGQLEPDILGFNPIIRGNRMYG